MLILFIITFIDLVSFGMIFPLLPLFKEAYLLTDVQVGYIASIFSLFNLIGSLFFGILSDKIGRRLALYLPILLLAAVYFINAYTYSYESLLILRALAGFLTGNFAVAFATVGDISTPETKFRNMGFIGMAFGLGFIVGPTVGGLIASIGDDIHQRSIHVFMTAGILAAIAGSVAFLYFKESLSKDERNQKTQVSVFTYVKELFNNKLLVLFVYLTVLFSLSLAGLEVYQSLWLRESFGWTSGQIGIYWGAFAILVTISQLGSPRILKSNQALYVGFSLFTLSQVMLHFVTNIYSLAIYTMMFGFAMGMIFPSINVNLSGQGTKNQQGLIFGINQSMGGLGRIIGPYVIGLLYQINHHYAWLLTATAGMFTIFILLLFLKKHSPSQSKNT